MRRHAEHTITDDEWIARYSYLVGKLPESVIEKAHAVALRQVAQSERRGILEALRPELEPAQRDAASDEPDAMAALLRRPPMRDALMRLDDASAVALRFVGSAPVETYFTFGAGSVAIDEHPPWVHELAGHEDAPVDAGTVNHRQGVNSGEWFITG